jgi:hypothetical protein
VTYMLPESSYDQIRMALDPMLDDGAIPDELIASPLYLGRAERWVLTYDAQAASRPDIELQDIHLAIILKTASLLSPFIPQTKQTNMAGHSATLAYAESPDERSARLAREAYTVLDALLTIPTASTLGGAVIVTTVSGRRA